MFASANAVGLNIEIKTKRLEFCCVLFSSGGMRDSEAQLGMPVGTPILSARASFKGGLARVLASRNAYNPRKYS